MTKGELIEQVLFRCQAATQDTNVRREDIANLIAPAINYAISKSYFMNKRMEGVSYIPQDFLTIFKNVDVQYDADTDEYYSVLPARVLSLNYERGINYVGSMQGDNKFERTTINSVSHNKYYSVTFSDTITWHLEGQKIVYRCIPSSVKSVKMALVASSNDLDDDQTLPIPAESEMEVLEILVQFMLGQREIPKDLRNDNN